MSIRVPVRRRSARGAAIVIACAIAMVGAPVPATADVTVISPGGPLPSGRTPAVTLSSNEIAPGERIRITGVNFDATGYSMATPDLPAPGTGHPLVAVRPYDTDLGPAWTIGGSDAYVPASQGVPPGSEARHWFQTRAEGPAEQLGTFTGWIQAPANLDPVGPVAGHHWLRILSGAYFTSTGNRLTEPISFTVPFTVVDTVRLGFSSPTGLFFQGTTFRPGALIVAKGRTFDPDAPVAVSLDGTDLPGPAFTTDADGVFPDSARVSLPTSVTPGPHVLRFATGAITHDVAITITAPPEVSLRTPNVRPGGNLAVDLSGFVGVTGAGQRVAVVHNEAVIACITADSSGSATALVPLPPSVPIGADVPIRFNAGLSCIPPPAGVVNDLPGSSTLRSLTVDPAAPAVSATPNAVGLLISGTGLEPNAPVTVTAASTVIGTLTTTAAGTVSGSVSAPDTGAGYRLLAATDASAAAAAVVPTAPGPVRSAKSVAGSRRVTVTWAAPTSGGGARLVGYLITPRRDGKVLPAIAVPAGATSYAHTGLTNGSAYTYAIAARNAAGAGAATPTTAVVPRDSVRLSITSAKSIRYGAAASISGKATTTSGAAAPGLTVKLQYRKKGSTGGWSTLSATAKSSVSGTMTFRTLKPAVSVEIRLVTATGGAWLGATSASKILTVTKAASRTTLALTPAKVKTTTRVKATVKIAVTGVPAPLGTVTIYDGTRRVATMALTTARRGSVTITLRPLTAGRHTIKASYGGTTTITGSRASKTITVTK